MRQSAQPVPQTLPPKMIDYAKRNDLILCNQHIPGRLQELNSEFFEILCDNPGLPCCRCGNPGSLLDLPFPT